MRRLKVLYGTELERLIDKAIALLEDPAPFDLRAGQMIGVIDSIGDRVATVAICRRGCSHCCRQAVTLSSWEAERIATATGRRRADPSGIEAGDDHDLMRKKYAGIDCPFLKDGECSVYDQRPLACRSHFSLAEDPAPCDIVNHPGDTVPYFHSHALTLAQAALFYDQGEKFADIREFFPTCTEG